MSNLLKNLKKIISKNPEITQLQQNVEDTITPIINNPILDGVLLKEVSLLSASTTKIQHKLGRTPLGYIITRKRADSRIWDAQDSNTLKTSTLALNCSSDVTIDIYIF